MEKKEDRETGADCHDAVRGSERNRVMKEVKRIMPTNFDEYADNYREIHTENVRALSGADSDYFSEYKIVEVAPLLEKAKILDFGCGDGNSAFFIQKHISAYEYYGIDVSAESVKKATERNLRNCTFSHYDGLHIPFPDETFSAVFAACVFHHIDEDNRIPMLKEIRRVLKTGGSLIVFEHNPLNPLTVRTVRDCPFDVGVKLMMGRGMRHMLVRAGFNKRAIRINYTIFMPRKDLFKKLLSLEKYFRKIPLGGQYYCIGGK